MTSCEKYIELISAAIDGEISDADRSALEIHLEFCPECRKAAEALSAISRNFPKEAEVPENFTAGTMAKIKAEAAKPTGFKKFVSGYGKYTGLAAALVVVLLGAHVFTNGFGSSKSSDAAAPESNMSTAYDTTALADMELTSESEKAESDYLYSNDYHDTVGDANTGVSTDTSTGEAGEASKGADGTTEPGAASDGNGSDSASPSEPIPEPEAVAPTAEPQFTVTVTVTDVAELYSLRGYTESFYSVSTLYAPAPQELAELLVSSDSTMVYSTTEEHHYKVPMAQLNELDPGVFTEIVFDDLTAEHGLVILLTPTDETEDD